MRIGTLVAGVLVMAAGFGLAALVIGWPALVVGGPLVFGGLVLAAVTYLNGMQQQHARQYRYAQVVHQQWAAAMPAFDGRSDSSYDGRTVWTEYRPLQDEDTLDSEELTALLAGLPSGVDVDSPDIGSPDIGSPDIGSPDIGSPDIGSPDIGSPDIGSPDIGSPATDGAHTDRSGTRSSDVDGSEAGTPGDSRRTD
jgi:hypothetical protein